VGLDGLIVAAALTLPVTEFLTARLPAPAHTAPAVPARSCQDTSQPLPVRVSNGTTLNDRHLRIIAGIVEAIWSPYGVRFDWRGRASGGVEVVIDSGTLPPGRGAVALPVASIDFVDGMATSRIRVSHGNARVLAARARLNDRSFVTLPPPLQAELIARMLGVAVAHELGHYLLNARSHSVQGLLRPNIPTSQLMDGNPRHLRLTAEQVAVLCQGMKRAAGPAVPEDGREAPAAGAPAPPGGVSGGSSEGRGPTASRPR
jgi:hypothetical protein